MDRDGSSLRNIPGGARPADLTPKRSTPLHLLAAILAGLGATAAIDLWALFLRRAFGIQSLNYCLLGRWVLHMPRGTFAHRSIAAAEPVRGEISPAKML
jgi:hypothetical protein